MMLRAGFGMVAVALLMAGGAIAAEPESAEAFRAECERRISPENPHGYQPIIDYSQPTVDPYTAELERRRRPGFKREKLIDLDVQDDRDDRFGNDVLRRQR